MRLLLALPLATFFTIIFAGPQKLEPVVFDEEGWIKETHSNDPAIEEYRRVRRSNEQCQPKDSDSCLQSSASSWIGYTCSSSTKYCESWGKDMKRCCPESCKIESFTETDCNSSSGKGTCEYPNDAQCPEIVQTCSTTLPTKKPTAPSSYTMLNKTHCYEDRYGSFSTIQSAKGACSNDPNCQGVYDQGCDSDANDIYLCPTSATYSTSSSSCVFQKNENDDCIPISLRVKAEFFEKSVKKASKTEILTVTTSSFRSNYDKFGSSLSYSIGFDAFSASAAFAFEKVTASSESFDGTTHREQSNEVEYKPGFLQIERVITTEVTINGKLAKTIESDFVDSVKVEQHESPEELKQRGKNYINDNFGNLAGEEGACLRDNVYTAYDCVKQDQLVSSRFCAKEDQNCKCYGKVKYGYDLAWTAERSVKGSIACSSGIFGDPAYGTPKQCRCKSASPCNPNFVDNEGDNCQTYVNKKYCNENGYGEMWDKTERYEDYAVNGEDASTCPQCGCKGQ